MPYLFIKGHFRVAVFATSQRDAFEYIKAQGISCLSYRNMRYAGHTNPTDPEYWLAANTPKQQALNRQRLEDWYDPT